MDIKKTGVLAVLTASVLWAIEPSIVKLAYANCDFIQLSAVRGFVITFIAMLYIFTTNKGNIKVPVRHLPKIVYLSLAGTLGADLLYYYSLAKIPVINAVLIGHLQPVFIVLIGFFILKEDKVNKFDYIGIAIMIFASLLVTTKTPGNLASLKIGTIGDLVVLIATVIWSTATIVTKKYLSSLNVGILIFYRFLFALPIFFIYLAATSKLILPNVYQLLVGVIVGVGAILYYEGLKRIKAAQVSSLELSTPFFAALLGYFILGELITAMQIIGILLLVLGICFLSKKEETYF
ncbi:MAG: DMT family transporter [Candidatus Brocadiia bacterium]|nr:MAG: DMT family transporter [Candidatus Brocadiia bacterium]